jgi:hypothetical protein
MLPARAAADCRDELVDIEFFRIAQLFALGNLYGLQRMQS